METDNEPSFGYCAARFLDQWVRKEERLHRALQNPVGPVVRAALAYFRVSRGFPGIADDDVASSVAKLLRRDGRRSMQDPSARVVSLAKAFGHDFNQQTRSAASKLLWLQHRAPFIIIDERAERALHERYGLPRKSSYEVYVAHWREAFASHRKEIALAARGLPTFVSFTAAASLGSPYVGRLVKQEWFLERAFDQYLWQVGENPKIQF